MPETPAKQSPFFIDPTGREHLLKGDLNTLGRAVENTIVITSKRISRSHVQVQRQGWRTVLKDLNSTNGTYVNDERIFTPVELHDGDQVRLGDVTLIFHDPDTTLCETPFPELELDVAAGTVRVDRTVITLSPKEFELLAHLYGKRGAICTKDEIGAAVWPEYQGNVYDYQIENLIRRLRTKIEPDPTTPQLVLTVRGMGYKLVVFE